MPLLDSAHRAGSTPVHLGNPGSIEFITGLFEFIKVLFGLLRAYLETGLS
jgi:hypothetical protein